MQSWRSEGELASVSTRTSWRPSGAQIPRFIACTGHGGPRRNGASGAAALREGTSAAGTSEPVLQLLIRLISEPTPLCSRLRRRSAEFSKELGSTITEVIVGAGPHAELRYPSYPAGKWHFPGVGEFQCYDRYLAEGLRGAAEEAGKPEWGERGPVDCGHYCVEPHETAFFWDDGSWTSEQGQFFLEVGALARHGGPLTSPPRWREGRQQAAALPLHQDSQTFQQGVWGVCNVGGGGGGGGGEEEEEEEREGEGRGKEAKAGAIVMSLSPFPSPPSPLRSCGA